MSSYKKIALYASYQTGKDLPGYVRFALSHLARTDFHVVLLTNEREFSQESLEFIGDNDIELFLTQNHGFDFGNSTNGSLDGLCHYVIETLSPGES